MIQFITHFTDRYSYLDSMRIALEGGCRWIQLRMKEASPEEIIPVAQEAMSMCRKHNATFIIDDHVEIVKRLGADGVHLGKNDMPIPEARKILGKEFIIGATANTFEDVKMHHETGADYIGCGPFRFTTTKKNLSPVLGLEGYANIISSMKAEGINLPIVAIGGITKEDIPALMRAGVTGIALSGSILRAENPVEEMKEIITICHSKELYVNNRFKQQERTMKKLIIAGREFNSRLFLGTGKFPNNLLMKEAILASETEMVTVAMKRVDLNNKQDDLLNHIVSPSIQLLPNTSGVRNAEEAIFAAQMAREAFGTNWLKLEIHPDPKYLLPDSIETLKATEQLVKLGFVVLPYCQADPTLCKHLEEAGAATVMPLGAPIGTNKGLQTRDLLRIIIEQANVPVVVDAGIGVPSHAAEAMEMGASACLVNTAIAIAENPIEMAIAFKEAVIAGRRAYEAGIGGIATGMIASASSPLTRFLDE